MIPKFPVKAGNGDFKIAECAFATHRDLSRIADWPNQVKERRDAATRDSLEFASHASKRWSFYHGQGLAVSSTAALKRKIAADKNAELALLLVARAEWAAPQLLGVALARRTWCGHVILDFLATHPSRIVAGPKRIRGIGRGLLYGLSNVALEIGARTLWGEATRSSAPIYQHIFGLQKLADLLYLQRPELIRFREEMNETMRLTNLR